VVHIDETGGKRDGEQAWIWTFRTAQHTLYAVRESPGSDGMFPRKSSARTSRERSSAMAGQRIQRSAVIFSGAGRIFSEKLTTLLLTTWRQHRCSGISRRCLSVSSGGWRSTRVLVNEHRCTDHARTG
jgi:hypothetical protein